MLDGAIVLGNEEIRLLIDGTSQQVATAILSQAEVGLQKGIQKILSTFLSNLTGSILQEQPPELVTRYIYGYDLEFKDSVGPALLGISNFSSLF
ncbi:MAG: hypothetical protein MUO26_15800 [Methanotrichaceae archaeon]|nr:hypothetical protein [Methanotrichaceae archaeon]